MTGYSDPQGTQARAIDTERKHPASHEDVPPSQWRKQVLVLALLFGIPALLYILARWL